jgi:hypothetical protein
MGKKSTPSVPAYVPPAQVTYEPPEWYKDFMKMSMSKASAGPPDTPSVLELPTAATVDLNTSPAMTEAEKTAAEEEEKRKKTTVADTIKTSPLLETLDPKLLKTILG